MFMSALHREDANGLDGPAATLAAAGEGDTPRQVLHDWLHHLALDGVLDRGASIDGARRGGCRRDTLDATVNWNKAETYSTPGAPPNGSDYVRLRNGAGAFLRAADLRSLAFDGAATLRAHAGGVAGRRRAGGAAGRSGAATRVPGTTTTGASCMPSRSRPERPTLTFHRAGAPRWPGTSAFVQVSTDGGRRGPACQRGHDERARPGRDPARGRRTCPASPATPAAGAPRCST